MKTNTLVVLLIGSLLFGVIPTAMTVAAVMIISTILVAIFDKPQGGFKMIIEQERDDSIIYGSATMQDFERVCENAQILRHNHWNRLERVDMGKGSMELQVVTRGDSGTSRLTVAEYNAQEQELTVYF